MQKEVQETQKPASEVVNWNVLVSACAVDFRLKEFMRASSFRFWNTSAEASVGYTKNSLFILFYGSRFHYRSQVCNAMLVFSKTKLRRRTKKKDSALKSIIFSVAHSYKRFQYEILLVVFTIARRYRSTAFCLSILLKKTLNKTFLWLW